MMQMLFTGKITQRTAKTVKPGPGQTGNLGYTTITLTTAIVIITSAATFHFQNKLNCTSKKKCANSISSSYLKQHLTRSGRLSVDADGDFRERD